LGQPQRNGNLRASGAADAAHTVQQMHFQKEMIASTLPVCFYVLLEA
jgi:hypothetical protein